MIPAPILAGRSILLVEDDFIIALDQATLLKEAGARVVGPAPTLAAALALVAGAEPLDGAILDLNLRGVMSFPVADALRARSVPFVFLTGYDRSIIPASYADVPVCDKPLNLLRIAQAMFG
jgi:CheY-like chemotaxis protein